MSWLQLILLILVIGIVQWSSDLARMSAERQRLQILAELAELRDRL